MSLVTLASSTLASALILCLTLPGAVAASDLLRWRDAENLPELMTELNTWINVHTNLPQRTDVVPEIRWIDRAQAAAMAGHGPAAHAPNTRGLYDPANPTILLVRPWSPRDPYDVSVLLHEMVHHRQAGSGRHWYCPGAQELPAYKAQRDWLAQMGLAPDVNWIAVVLASGCTPRDIHPD